MDQIITHCHACHDLAWSGLEITLIRQLYYVRYAKQPHLAPHLSQSQNRIIAVLGPAGPLPLSVLLCRSAQIQSQIGVTVWKR